jgi:hypothetical protein
MFGNELEHVVNLAEETLLFVKGQFIGVVKERLNVEKMLQVIHHNDGIGLQLVSIDNVKLFGVVEVEPTL